MRYVAAILAGGQSSRFGADKALAKLGDAPMIVHVARRLGAGAGALAVVGHAEAAALLHAVALGDAPGAPAGPLAGLLAALDWAGGSGAAWLVTAPCDTPLIPADMGARLVEEAQAGGARAAHAQTTDGLHPLCAAWSPALAGVLRELFARGDDVAVRALEPGALRVDFPDPGAFLNVNTAADAALALARLRGGKEVKS